MLKSICEYIQANDKHSDIMDCYREYLNGEMPEEVLVLICERILTEWEVIA